MMRWCFRSLATLVFLFMCGIGSTGQAADKRTERLWKSKCASCHGADGKGDTDQGKKSLVADMTTKAWKQSHSDAQIKKAIEDGVKRETKGVKQEMDGYKDSLKPEDVDALVNYVKSLGTGS